MRKVTVSLVMVLVLLAASLLVLAKPAFGVAEDENSWISKVSMGLGLGIKF